jgi:peptidoglycan/LPS O-acetylase OafA/YrhL
LTQPTSHPLYRPDIDGLRALAVLLVVGYHAFPTQLKSGFIGVDVFFVISGYLISTIIFTNLRAGTFSFVTFYRRRINRIFPALSLVLISCLVFGWFALLPSEFKQLGQHLAGGAAFVSNFVLWRESGYFDSLAETKPLLHLWSLAIEEQCYLVFPIVVFFMNTKRRLAIILIAVSAWSLITMILSSTETSAPYFSTSNRIAQLAFGGLCALFVSSKMHTELRANIKTIVNAVALAVLLLLIPFYSAKQAVPSILSLVPVGLTCIFLVLPRKQIIVSVLSFKPIQIIGRASFSIYLVHQPLLAFSKILIYGTPYSMPTAIEKSAMVAGCVLTGVVSWRLIEEPVRRLRGKLEIVSVVAILASAVLLYVHANRVIETGGYPKRIPASAAETLARRDIAMASAELKMVRDCAYETSFVDLGTSKDNAEFQRCTNTYGPPILVAGDSHAEDLFNALSINLPERFVLGVYRHSASHAEFADELSKTITISKPNLQVILFTLEASTWIDSNIIQIDQLKIDTNVILDSAIQIQKYEKFVWLGPQIEPRIDLYGFNPLVGIVRELNTVRMSEQLSIQVDKIFKRLAKKSAVAYLSKIEIVKFDYRKDFDVPEGFTYGDRTHWSTVGEKVFGKRIIDDPRIQELLK